MFKRTALLMIFAFAGFGGVTLGSGFGVALADTGGGNSAAAQACQQGGYTALIGTDGTTDTTFSRVGQCVSEAAQGGMLVALSAAQPCLDGGWKNLTPGGSAPAFTGEAACVQFVGSGGTLTPVVAATFGVGDEAGMGDVCYVGLYGWGLYPNAPIYANGTQVATAQSDGTFDEIVPVGMGPVTFTMETDVGSVLTFGPVAPC